MQVSPARPSHPFSFSLLSHFLSPSTTYIYIYFFKAQTPIPPPLPIYNSLAWMFYILYLPIFPFTIFSVFIPHLLPFRSPSFPSLSYSFCSSPLAFSLLFAHFPPSQVLSPSLILYSSSSFCSPLHTPLYLLPHTPPATSPLPSPLLSFLFLSLSPSQDTNLTHGLLIFWKQRSDVQPM